MIKCLYFVATVAITTHPLCVRKAEQPGGSNHEDREKNDESEDLLEPAAHERIEIDTSQILREANHESPDEGARNAVESAEYRGGKRREPDKAHVGVKQVAVGENNATKCRHGSRQRPRERKDPLDADTHQLCRVAVLGHRPHRSAEPRPVKECEKETRHQSGRTEGPKIDR